jgi:DNA-nicking Smr family endonuclease
MSENDDFLKAMGDVKPIKVEQRVLLPPKKQQKKSLHPEAVTARREAAQMLRPNALLDPLSESCVPQLDPHAILEFRRPGVQHGVYKQLRLGRYVIDARLDLHGMTIEQARQTVYQFVRDCMSNDIRCALITHGKGEGRQRPAVLKSHIAHWLPQINEVLAFYSAQPQHGGSGACYVLLKKSEKKRLENVERYQRRF